MKSRSTRSIFAVTMVFALLFGASPVFSQDKASLLQERCTDYYKSIAEGRYGNMWDMSSRDIQDGITREEYVARLQVFDKYTSFSISIGYDQCAKLVEGRNNIAISKVFIYFKDVESIGECDLLVFLWIDDNWYFFQALNCEYENDVSGMMKQIFK